MVDCLVIGGGGVGLSIAYEMAARGKSVRVLDRREFGSEASWAGAGILPPGGSKNLNHPLDQMQAASSDLHREWAARLSAETGVDTGYRECGGVYLAGKPGEVASLLGLQGWFAERGVEMHRVTHSELREFEPALVDDPDRIRAAFLLPGEAQLRNPHHLSALQQACRRRGVDLVPHCEVTEFEILAEQVVGVASRGQTYRADRYCLTSGAWTHQLLEQLSISNGILPVRGQIVLFRGDRQLFRRVINEGPRYIVPRDDGRVLVGSTEEEVGYHKGTTDEAIAELTDLAHSLVPQLRDAQVERTWSGLRPGSFDGFPYMGRVVPWSNVFVAAGHFRSGLFLSPAIAVAMSQLMCGETPTIDLTPFAPHRG